MTSNRAAAQKPARAKSSRSPQREAYTPDSVADAAFALFKRLGYDATSLDQVANELGVTKAALYYHHASKESILTFGIDRALRQLETVLEEGPAIDSQATALARFEYVVRRAMSIGLHFHDEVAVLYRLRGNSDLESQIVERRRVFDHAAAEILKEATTSGELPADTDPLVMTRLVTGLIISTVEWYRPDGAYKLEELVELTVRFAVGGLLRS
jgi:AcrR family transcriptional regulator